MRKQNVLLIWKNYPRKTLLRATYFLLCILNSSRDIRATLGGDVLNGDGGGGALVKGTLTTVQVQT